jgi:hypothetical protein
MTRRCLFWSRITAGMALAITVAALLVAYQSSFGVQVSVSNDGDTPVHDLVVHVTGRSYPIGDVQPGSSRNLRVNPTSESHLELEFTGEDGRRVRLDAGGYFEPGYRGRIDVRIKDGKIEDSQGQPLPSIY